MSGRLVVCPTPIGNLGDVTLRVLDALRSADVIACEDTRRTRVLLEAHSIPAGGRLVSYHEHNERGRARDLAARIDSGEVVALVTDAGTPLVSDPGWAVVQACVEASLPVEALPGASSVLVALVASGLATDRWSFIGFLPRKAGELASVWSSEDTLVAFESPKRVGAALASLAAADPSRRVAVCRELTKVHEEVVRGTAGELAERYAREEVRGEVVVVVGGAAAGARDEAAAADAVRALIDAGARARPAATVVASLTGTSANDLYRKVAASSSDGGR